MAHYGLMPNWDKTDLENIIFYRASLEKALLLAREGILFSVKGGRLLQCLISVYNAFFAQENSVFLADEIERLRQEQYCLWREYKAEKQKNPTRVGFSLRVKNPR